MFGNSGSVSTGGTNAITTTIATTGGLKESEEEEDEEDDDYHDYNYNYDDDDDFNEEGEWEEEMAPGGGE